jgi:uncharacterized membrane protein YphA (DoxX/SURF4 family)
MTTHLRSIDELVTAEPVSRSDAATSATLKAGRVVFAVPFLLFGVTHFLNASAMAGMVPVPGGAFWIYVTGAALVAGSLGILTGKLGRLAAFGLAALLLVFIGGVHLPQLANAATQQMAIINVLKDASLLGGALTWAAILGKR